MKSCPLSQELRPFYLGGRKLPHVVALAAYFDDSYRYDRASGDPRKGICVMAGYIAPVEVWDEVFTPTWREIIETAPHKIREFKASDCRQGKKEFAAPWTASERLELMSNLVSTIAGWPPLKIIGVGAATVLDFGQVRSEKERRALIRFGYLWSFSMVSAICIRTAGHILGEDNFQPVFDESEHQSKALEAYRSMREIFEKPETADRIRPPHFGPSHLIEPLQAADFLAHETYKEMDNRSSVPQRQASRALERLVGGVPHIARYWDAYELRDRNALGITGDEDSLESMSKLVYDSVNSTGTGIVRDG